MSIFRTVLSIDPTAGLLFFFFLTTVFLAFYLIRKVQNTSALKIRLVQLNKIIKDLDQQAKLIIKSDMELKLTQQEIEDKLNKLTLIKNLIISSAQTLDKEKLLDSINEKVINDIGFKKGLILDFESLDTKINVGFKANEIETLRDFVKYKKQGLKNMPLIYPDLENYENRIPNIKLKEILIAPIKAREHVYSIFIVSNLLLHTEIQKSEEEAFIIICMYLSQWFDNIRLFEDLYHTKDDLEKKIKERTGELIKSLRAIEAISKTKSDFISSVSHELRTPLTSVKGFSSLLVAEKFGKLPDEAKKRLIKIDVNVNKLVAIVNILLDISRIESGKMEIKIAPYNLVRLIKDTADFLSPQIADKKIKLNLDIPESLSAYMDKNLIERVLINLINNAIKFTSENGQIKISCLKEDSYAIVSIMDTGCGIEKNDLDKVFQEFYRTKTTQTIQGSGLGLSLVRKIIDTHKERIWVESEIGKGTTFSFTLRLEKNA